MPYKVEGRDVYKLTRGSWKLKQHTRSHENALKAMRLLIGIEYGWVPMGGKRR